MTALGATCYYLGFALLASGLFAWLRLRVTTFEHLRCMVWRNLDSAWNGGCFNAAEAGYLHEMTAPEIADDMTLYCDDVCGYDARELLPHVRAWMAKREIAA